MSEKQRPVHLADIELRDAVNGGDPVIVVNGFDLSKSVIGYSVNRSQMSAPPVLTIQIAVGKMNDESRILRAVPGPVVA